MKGSSRYITYTIVLLILVIIIFAFAYLLGINFLKDLIRVKFI